MRSFPRKHRKRRALATIENLENLSFNTRRFLSRSQVQKLTDDEARYRKSLKTIRRRLMGSANSSPKAILSNVDLDMSNDVEKFDELEGESSDVAEDSVRNDNGNSSGSECEKADEAENDRADSVGKDHESVTDVESSSRSDSENPDEIEIEIADSVEKEDESFIESESEISDGIENEVLKTEEQTATLLSENESKSEGESVAEDAAESEPEMNVDSTELGASYRFRSPQKCKYCRQTDVLKYSGPRTDSRMEADILSLEDLKVSVEEDEDEPPQYRLTEFSVFDKAGHLCPFDGDMLQQNVRLYFSGYIKPVYDDDPKAEGGYPCKEMGPITEWWITGLDGSDENERVIVGFSSDRADYYLLEPTTEYAPFLRLVTEKISVTKMVFQFLLSNAPESEQTLEELVSYLERQNVDEGKLMEFANFIYEQIFSYDSGADEDELHLLNSKCMQELAQLADIEPTTETDVIPRRRRRRIQMFRRDMGFRKATITQLVQSCFESLFPDQMDKSSDVQVRFKLKRCEVRLTRLAHPERYASAWTTDFISHSEKDPHILRLEREALKNNLIQQCKIKIKPLCTDLLNQYMELRKRSGRDSFNLKRKLPNDDNDEENEFLIKKIRRFSDDTVKWQSEGEEIDGKTHYRNVKVGSELVRVGDFVSMRYSDKVGLIKYMYEDDNEKTFGHFQWFWHSHNTILRNESAKQELFMTDECEDVKLSEVDEVLDVVRLYIPPDDFRGAGSDIVTNWLAQNRKQFFYQKRYVHKYGQFLDLPDDIDVLNTCTNCSRKKELENREIPLPIGETEYDRSTEEYTIKKVRWRDENFSAGSCVFLHPGSLMQKRITTKELRFEEVYDDELYPEKYRKKFTNDEDRKEEPFDVGFITRIFTKRRRVKRSKDVYIEVKKFYRPQNTHLGRSETDRENLNKLYWSDDECVLAFDKVEGKCFVSYERNVKITIEEWTDSGPYRFYFAKAYDRMTKRFLEPPHSATNIGKLEKDNVDANVPYDWPAIEPLATMDVFAGCGGLSDGLHQSGVADCRWAIEKFSAPAEAFRLNNRKAVVYQHDCNDLLLNMLNPETKEDFKLPKRGEVDLLCGGPPCQGFSRMNRFKDGLYSKFKNSLVTTYLSFCDHFRPRFFILENVRDFVSTNQSLVFKLTVSCLVRMGYQVGFSILQCGTFGIPQSRRRTIIIAAAPGEILPKFPEPTHTFPKNTFLDITIDGERYKSDIRWTKSAPFRTTTVGDAISDLPKIENNDRRPKLTYMKKPQTHFQKMMRGVNSDANDELREHVCKKLAPLILKRITYIPREPAGDWRDLPNISFELPDGTRVQKLKYTHDDWKNPRTSKGQVRGVCCCATSPTVKCSNEWKQKDTLIPWCLPHTSNRHNQWSGLYGRVPKDSYFRTVVTNPEPMGKQGRVLHPDQDRVVSVRECARSQGFKDSFQFYGDILDKYAQIGNAVAPPLGRAIGLEIRKSVAAKLARDRGSMSDC